MVQRRGGQPLVRQLHLLVLVILVVLLVEVVAFYAACSCVLPTPARHQRTRLALRHHQEAALLQFPPKRFCRKIRKRHPRGRLRRLRRAVSSAAASAAAFAAVAFPWPCPALLLRRLARDLLLRTRPLAVLVRQLLRQLRRRAPLALVGLGPGGALLKHLVHRLLALLGIVLGVETPQQIPAQLHEDLLRLLLRQLRVVAQLLLAGAAELEARLRFAVHEEHERRRGADLVTRGRLAVVPSVHFGEDGGVAHLFSKGLVRRRDHAARSARVRVKIHH
mmetsp:Transcript_9178/g.34532  ORF Transcript_9178/g.34532 Transcript_9178/m.34532 type:complete len:277 (-) Transcript_9178:260-1090(-)